MKQQAAGGLHSHTPAPCRAHAANGRHQRWLQAGQAGQGGRCRGLLGNAPGLQRVQLLEADRAHDASPPDAVGEAAAEEQRRLELADEGEEGESADDRQEDVADDGVDGVEAGVDGGAAAGAACPEVRGGPVGREEEIEVGVEEEEDVGEDRAVVDGGEEDEVGGGEGHEGKEGAVSEDAPGMLAAGALEARREGEGGPDGKPEEGRGDDEDDPGGGEEGDRHHEGGGELEAGDGSEGEEGGGGARDEDVEADG